MPILFVLPSAKSDDVDEWTYRVLDAGDPVLEDADIVVDSRGIVHVVSDNGSLYGLDYRTNEGGVWRSEFIPGPEIENACPYVSYVSIAVDENYKAHIAFTVYFDVTPFWGSSLLYATNSDGAWLTEFVDQGTPDECYKGDRPAIVVTPKGGLEIFYLGSYLGDDYDESLRHATRTGHTWQVAEVDPVVVLYYDSFSHVMDSKGASHISGALYSESAGVWELIYATDSSGAWTSSVVQVGRLRGQTSICLDPQGHPHIGMPENINTEGGILVGSLSHCWMANVTWSSETVYTCPNLAAGEDVSMASDSLGNIHAIYRGDLFKDLYSTNEGGSWQTVCLSYAVSYYDTNSLYSIAVDRNNTVHAVFSEDEYGNCAVFLYAFREAIPVFPIPYTLVMSEIEELPLTNVGQTVTVTAYDQFGSICLDYEGTVHFSSNSTDGVILPEDYQFQVSDQGQHTFSGEIVFLSEGWYTVNCMDALDADLADFQSGIHAVPEPPAVDSLELVLPTWSDVGAPFGATLSAISQYGGVCENYTGTVRFTSSDPGAVLPGDYTFTVSDEGVHIFADEFVLVTNGTQTIAVADVLDSTLGGSAEILVAVCEYSLLTIPYGSPVDFRMFESEFGPSYYIHLNPVEEGPVLYEFMGLSLYTLEVGNSGGINVRGNFRFSDELVYYVANCRRLFVYVMDDNSSTILRKECLLDYTTPMNQWHWRDVTLTGFTPGETVRIGVGRYLEIYYSGDWPDPQLTAEWAGVEVTRPEDLPPAPPILAPLTDCVTPCGKETTYRVWAWDPNLPESINYTWDFGDGTPLVVGNPVNYVYTSMGSFNFTVYVDDGTGFNVSSSATATVTVAEGTLRVVLDPVVPGMVYVNGEWITRWGIECLMLPAGDYEVSFGGVVGHMTPPAQMVTVESGVVTTVTAEYVEMATLRVITSPAVPSTISVDGIDRNDWGLWVYVQAGTYEVSFGEVPDYTPPPPVTVTLVPGEYVEITAEFLESPGAPGEQSPYGLLRVETNRPLPTTIFLDGIWRTQYGIDWLKLAPGTYLLSHSVIPFWGGCGWNGSYSYSQYVTIVEGQTTSCMITSLTLAQNPVLIVRTDPPVPTTIFMNGIARSSWGLTVDCLYLPDPEHLTYFFSATVEFSPVAGYETPAQGYVYVPSGQTRVYVWEFDSIW